jgi:hypothetical protein
MILPAAFSMELIPPHQTFQTNQLLNKLELPPQATNLAFSDPGALNLSETWQAQPGTKLAAALDGMVVCVVQ